VLSTCMQPHGTLHGRSPVGKRARRAEHMHAAARNAARTLTVAADVECPPLPPPLLPPLPLATAADVARESASSRASLASSASSVVTSVELPFGTCCGETERRGERLHARQGRVELPFGTRCGELAVGNSLWGTRRFGWRSRVIKGHQGSSRVIKGHQGSSRSSRSSRVIKGHQGPSRVIDTCTFGWRDERRPVPVDVCCHWQCSRMSELGAVLGVGVPVATGSAPMARSAYGSRKVVTSFVSSRCSST